MAYAERRGAMIASTDHLPNNCGAQRLVGARPENGRAWRRSCLSGARRSGRKVRGVFARWHQCRKAVPGYPGNQGGRFGTIQPLLPLVRGVTGYGYGCAHPVPSPRSICYTLRSTDRDCGSCESQESGRFRGGQWSPIVHLRSGAICPGRLARQNRKMGR